MELKTTITVNKEVAEALKNLYNKIDSMDWDTDLFADACFAIACNEDSFNWGLTEINIIYKED